MKLHKLDPKLLMMGFALPGAAHALGLGEIHIASALGDPLVARIDLIGASNAELADLRASIASDALFRSRGIDRPAFLATTTLKLDQDPQGRPVILLQSQQPVVEPLVNLLVDLQSANGELMREYTVLLDPPGFGAEARQAAGTQANTKTETKLKTKVPAKVKVKVKAEAVRKRPRRPRSATRAKSAQVPSMRMTYTVSPHDTLSRIAQRAGAATPADERRLMIAVFKDNPAAFSGNLNLLHSGATLRMPTAAELAAIDPAAAAREFATQMHAWHVQRQKPSVLPAPVATIAALNRRIATLQQSIAAVRSQLNQPLPLPAPVPSPHQRVNQASAPAATHTTSAAAPAPVSAPAPAHPGRLWRLAADLGALFAALAALVSLWRARRPRPLPEADSAPAGVDSRPSGDTTVQLAAPTGDFTGITAILEQPAELTDETAEHLLRTFDPEHSINTTHVSLPAALNDRSEFVERRKSPADVLRQAIEREPERNDLRLKLLELYYTAAAENRRAFLEVARRLSKRNGALSAEEWAQIANMGREIAAEEKLFAAAVDAGSDIADCA